MQGEGQHNPPRWVVVGINEMGCGHGGKHLGQRANPVVVRDSDDDGGGGDNGDVCPYLRLWPKYPSPSPSTACPLSSHAV